MRTTVLYALLGLFILGAGDLCAGYYDSGFIQFQQPNGTTFIGREYGDEFIFYRETEAGYRYVLSANGWYYYCSSDSRGDLIATSSRVAIDSPPSVSYHAEYAGHKLAEIRLRRAEFENQVQVNGEWFNQTQQRFRAIHQPTTLNVGVILVEFTDVKHRRTTERALGYLSADFDSMLFSQHFWYAPKESTQYTSPHPEGHYLYGSMRDYYWDMSRPNGDSSALIVAGTLINHDWPDTPGVPIWIELDSTRAYYDLILPPSDTTIFNEAIQKAITHGWLPQEWWLTYQKLIVIYADQILFGGGLNPRANSRDGHLALLGERYNIGFLQPKFFTHIGFYAHEFGHLIGFHDEYCAENSSCAGTDPGTFEIMARGYANGPFPAIGSCPSSMSPYYKIKNGWAQELLVSNDTTGFKVNYDYAHPPYYRMNPLVPGSPNECFVFETRLRRGTFDLYTPTRELADSNRQSGSLLIWRHDSGFDRLMLVHARNGSPLGDTLYTYFPGDRSINRQSFNDESTPAPFLYDGTLAHFALNGIHRDQLTNLTWIDTMRAIAGAGLISRDTSWSGIVNVNNDVNVVLGAKLTITQGAVIHVGQGLRRFAINAAPGSTIEANGTASQPITFRSPSGQPNTWLGLKTIGTGKLQLQNCRLRHALDGISIGSTVDSLVSIEIDSGSTGITATAGHPLIKNCVFRNLSVAVDLSTSGVATIANCTFLQGELSVRCSRSSPRVFSNYFQYSKNPIEMYDASSPFIANNLFIGRDDGNGTAIHMPPDDGIRPVIVNNTIAKFNYGCLADPINNGAIAHPSIRNNIFYLNWLSSSPEGGTIQGGGSLTHTNIYNRDTATYTPPTDKHRTRPHVR